MAVDSCPVLVGVAEIRDKCTGMSVSEVWDTKSVVEVAAGVASSEDVGFCTAEKVGVRDFVEEGDNREGLPEAVSRLIEVESAVFDDCTEVKGAGVFIEVSSFAVIDLVALCSSEYEWEV